MIVLSRVCSEGTLREVDEKPPEINVLVPQQLFTDMDGNKAMITIHHEQVQYSEDLDGTSIIVPIELILRGDFKKGDRVILHNFVYEFLGGVELG